MKKFIKNSIRLLLVFVVFFIIPVIIIGNYDGNDKFNSTNINISTVRIKSQFDSLDVLFLGSSYSYSAIQPVILDNANIKSFNLSVATAGVEFYDIIINDYLKHVNEPPKIIFILVAPMTFSNTADDFNTYPIHRYLETPLNNFDIALKFDHFDKLIPMYKRSFTKGIKHVLAPEGTLMISKQEMKDRGFTKNDAIITDSIILAEDHFYAPLLTEKFDYKKVNKLLKLSNSLKKKGIDIVFFELPTYKLKNYLSTNYLLGYEKGIKMLEKYSTVYRIDEKLFTDSNYRNVDHLNTSGSIIATKEIMKILTIDKKDN